MNEPDILENQLCPMCNNKTLTLVESEKEVPYFGKMFVFSMDCTSCKFHKADVEASEQRPACKWSFEISSEEDMRVRVVKSSNATIKVARIATVTPGPASNGYVTNIEGILNRIKVQTEKLRDDAEDNNDRKKAKNQVKKILNIMWGKEKVKLTIEDPSGNSAIISDKAVKE